jgi:hypothetical protein
LSFEFFKFERKPHPTFLRGCFPGDPMHLRCGLKVPNFLSMETSLPFILKVHRVCETVFNVMLSAYIAGLNAYYNHSKDKGEKQGSKRPSLDGWDKALQLAELAQSKFREAEDQRKSGDVISADATVQRALEALQTRYPFTCLPV